jgi:hypothetical protein
MRSKKLSVESRKGFPLCVSGELRVASCPLCARAAHPPPSYQSHPPQYAPARQAAPKEFDRATSFSGILHHHPPGGASQISFNDGSAEAAVPHGRRRGSARRGSATGPAPAADYDDPPPRSHAVAFRAPRCVRPNPLASPRWLSRAEKEMERIS